MNKNIHPVERIIRVVGGAVLASMAFWGPQNMWFLLGLIPLATGLMGWCPPYAMLGINTAKMCGAKCGCGTPNQPKGMP
jgi:hypothetical protein